MKKTGAIVSLVISSVIFCVSCAAVIFALVSQQEPEQKYMFNINGTEICELAVPEVNIIPETGNINNIDSRAIIAEKLRNNTDTTFTGLKKSQLGNGVTQYTFDGSIVRIDVPSGYGGFGCNRSYYYNYGMLYMADMYMGSSHEKMYFCDDIMYRHINTDSTSKSIAFDDKDYMAIAKFTLCEGYKFIK